MTIENFKSRLVEFIASLPESGQNKFEDSCGLPRGTITSIKKKGPSVEVLMKISNKHPELNLNWLIRGEGNMTMEEPTEVKSAPAVQVNSINTVNIGNLHELIVPLQEQMNELCRTIKGLEK